MTPQAINLTEKLSRFDSHWSPRIVAEMNDYQFKLVKLKGDFVWHTHEDTDETFIVIAGEMQVGFRDRELTLRAGEMCVIPKGVEHITRAPSECHAMIIEPRGVVNTGDAGGALTAKTDLWV
jgi:mannose-6-phosphate isomerase-like protein (cupin superfamily)